MTPRLLAMLCAAPALLVTLAGIVAALLNIARSEYRQMTMNIHWDNAGVEV